MSAPTVLDALNAALRQALADDPRVLLLGEDILDPYGGAFKVTRGLSSAFPERVLATPISEAGITGVATGMALRGLRPVVEIMFGDFTTLVLDQLTNHAAKFAWMYNGAVSLPLVVRAPMGGRRDYGPTHSQSLEKLFMGEPGLRVLAPANLGDPGRLLYDAILGQDDPVFFVENKLQYLLPVLDAADLGEFELREGAAEAQPPAHAALTSRFAAPHYRLSIAGAPAPALTLAAYGYMAEPARHALLELAYEHEIFAELVVITQLAPLDMAPILGSARHTGRLLAVEEGSPALGWGAEVLARAVETPGLRLTAARRLAGPNHPIPAAVALENRCLPGADDIVRAVKSMV